MVLKFPINSSDDYASATVSWTQSLILIQASLQSAESTKIKFNNAISFSPCLPFSKALALYLFYRALSMFSKTRLRIQTLFLFKKVRYSTKVVWCKDEKLCVHGDRWVQWYATKYTQCASTVEFAVFYFYISSTVFRFIYAKHHRFHIAR